MNLELLKQKSQEFKEQEGRASFYDLAAQLLPSYPLQAAVLLLATWNVSRFRFIVSNPQHLSDLEKALNDCTPLFEKIKEENFSTTDFDKNEKTIKQIYDTLSRVKGVEYTGTSKVMHLFHPHLFVIWDNYIRKGYHYQKTSAEYFRFLKDMQSRFKDLPWDDPNKTLAKAIDEYNYVTISLPKIREIKSKKKKP